VCICVHPWLIIFLARIRASAARYHGCRPVRHAFHFRFAASLLSNLIDYAGCIHRPRYPFTMSPKSMRATSVPALLDFKSRGAARGKARRNALGEGWRITLLADGEPAHCRTVETLETKLAHRLSLPTYCEAPLEQIAGAFAKLRTGGLTPDAIPSAEAIADFLAEQQHGACHSRRLPSASSIRSRHPLTYASDSPRAVMHGFVNVFAARPSPGMMWAAAGSPPC